MFTHRYNWIHTHNFKLGDRLVAQTGWHYVSMAFNKSEVAREEFVERLDALGLPIKFIELTFKDGQRRLVKRGIILKVPE